MSKTVSYVLGLDLGVASIGWAVVGLDRAGVAVSILKSGVHLFESGTEGDVRSGRDESRAGPRRMARSLRRGYWRRARRKRKLLRILQRLGLMPGVERDTFAAEATDALVKSLDAELRDKWEKDADHRQRQLLPYRLRAEGIKRRLEPFELGRAFYHLAQRRGFLSNRRDVGANSDDEEAGQVRAGIIELGKLMEAAGKASTLGDFFASLDPTNPESRRIRGRWTARDMYLAEFDRLWAEQAKHHAVLTEDARKIVNNAIFFQRPLKSTAHLVGECELHPGEKRARMATRIAQRFRLLQRVNDLEVFFSDHTRRRLSAEERSRVIAGLMSEGDLTFTVLRSKSYLDLRGTTFNLEEGGEKRIAGNRTDAKLRAIFGDRFDAMLNADKDAIVDDLLSFEKPSALARRGRKVWGLDEEVAGKLGDLLLEQGHAAHCTEALRRLVAKMEDGTPYATARKALYPDSFKSTKPVSLLPPVPSAMGDIRNPGVTRALSELRKLVNAVVRRFGKPHGIRVELARDLKRSRKMRDRMSRESREQETRRDRAKEELLRKVQMQQPTRSDIERILLADECGWICPYTGRSFGMEDLFGKAPKLDVEHIWPLPRSLDDSFLNKTLCWHEENRARKRNRTPFEAYAQNPERWEEIIDRVKRFGSDVARIKLERFKAEAIPGGFTERHLAETRYTSVLAAEYLGVLYGGRVDAEHRQRVFVTTGGLTFHLRREWMLDSVLSHKDEKNRADVRHHAIDAIVVALTDMRSVQMLQRAAEEASVAKRRLFAPVEPPWTKFIDEVRASVEAINVSYRQNRRVSGKLHADTLYSKEIDAGGPKPQRRVRKELHRLTMAEVDRIADSAIRSLVKKKLSDLKLDPAKAFIEPKNHPYMTTKAGGIVPIHKVRVTVQERPWTIGKGSRQRFVTSTAGSNHHTLIIEAKAFSGSGKYKKAKTVWMDSPVTLIEAHRRKGSGEPIVDRSPEVVGSGEFVFSLAPNEYVFMRDEHGVERLYRVLSISEGDIEIVLHTDGRMSGERRHDRVRIRASALKDRAFRKTSVTYLGEIQNARG